MGAEAATIVSALDTALQNYYSDEGTYPAMGKSDPDQNDFPHLFNALMDAPRPEGKGGRSAPYLVGKMDEDKVAVEDEVEDYRPSNRRERNNNKIDKYLLDPWGNPYVYRCNKGLSIRHYMLNAGRYDIYSLGPNGEDETVVGTEGEENDDITN